MNGAEIASETLRWLRYSKEDLTAGEFLVEQSNSAPRHVCWLAQQAAEKALKAVLVFLQIDFPKTHDLDALHKLVPDGWKLKTEIPDLSELSEWSVEARYPGLWPDATQEEAHSALQQSRTVWETVRRELSERGIDLDETGKTLRG